MQASYRIKFTLNQKGGEYHFFSIPQSNHYQLIQNLTIFPQSKNIVSDQWGNKVLCYRLNDVSEKYIIQGLYSPIAYSNNVKDTWLLSDYSSDLISRHSYLLSPDRFVNCNDKEVKRISQSISKKGGLSLNNLIKDSYESVMRYLTYGQTSIGLYSYKQALENKVTDCGGFSTLLISLLQSLGIPSRLVVGFLSRPGIIKSSLAHLHSHTSLLPSVDLFALTFNSFYMHVWAESLLPDETWFPLDPSIEWQRNKGLIKSEGGYGYVPADRLVVSFGEDFTLNIDKKTYTIDLLQHPVSV